MVYLRSALIMLAAATAKAAIVSSSAFTVTEVSATVGYPGPIITVSGSAPFSAISPSSVSTFDGSGVLSSVISGVFSTLGPGITSAAPSTAAATYPAGSSAFTSSGPVATSTAVFTFTYVPISTVTVTEYRCRRPTSVVSIPLSTATSRPITISEPGYPVSSFSAFPGGTISASSFLPEGTVNATSVVFSQPTASFSD